MGVGNRFARPQAGGGLGNRAPSLDFSFLSSTVDPRLTYSRASVATDGIYTDTTGSSYNSFSSGVPRISPANGLWIEGFATNYLLNSTAPATQTTGSLGINPYVLWVIGTGSAAVSAGTATITGAGTATAGNPVFFNVTVAGTVTVTVTGSLTRFQLEQNAVPTSFISTAGATAQRQQDSVSISLGSWYNAAAMSFAAECKLQYLGSPTQTPILMNIDDGTNANRISMNLGAALHDNALVSNAGTNTTSSTTNSFSTSQIIRGSASFSALGESASLLGGTPSIRTALPAGGIPAGVTTLRLGVLATGGAALNGYLRKATYYPRDLYPADLQRVSSL